MAAALAQRRFGGRIRTGFAGRSPATAFGGPMVGTMERIGIDMGYRHPEPVDQALFGCTPDLTIVMDDHSEMARIPGKEKRRWAIAEPVSWDDDTMDRLRMEIDDRVHQLKQWAECPEKQTSTEVKRSKNGRTP
jgi:hypothetical protein